MKELPKGFSLSHTHDQPAVITEREFTEKEKIVNCRMKRAVGRVVCVASARSDWLIASVTQSSATECVIVESVVGRIGLIVIGFYHCLVFSVSVCVCLWVSPSVFVSPLSLCLALSVSLALSMSLCLCLYLSLCLRLSVCLSLSSSPPLRLFFL